MRPLRVGFLGFNGVMALDLVGRIDAFTTAGIDESDGKAGSLYETVIIGLSNEPFRSETGIAFNPDKTIANAPPLDTLMIPRGGELPDPHTPRKLADWLHKLPSKL